MEHAKTIEHNYFTLPSDNITDRYLLALIITDNYQSCE